MLEEEKEEPQQQQQQRQGGRSDYQAPARAQSATAVAIAPQKFIYPNYIVVLGKDICFCELSLKGDLVNGQQISSLNYVKYVDHVKVLKSGLLSIYLGTREEAKMLTSREYIVERFRSFGDQNFRDIAEDIDSFMRRDEQKALAKQQAQEMVPEQSQQQLQQQPPQEFKIVYSIRDHKAPNLTPQDTPKSAFAKIVQCYIDEPVMLSERTVNGDEAPLTALHMSPSMLELLGVKDATEMQLILLKQGIPELFTSRYMMQTMRMLMNCFKKQPNPNLTVPVEVNTIDGYTIETERHMDNIVWGDHVFNVAVYHLRPEQVSFRKGARVASAPQSSAEITQSLPVLPQKLPQQQQQQQQQPFKPVQIVSEQKSKQSADEELFFEKCVKDLRGAQRVAAPKRSLQKIVACYTQYPQFREIDPSACKKRFVNEGTAQ